MRRGRRRQRVEWFRTHGIIATSSTTGGVLLLVPNSEIRDMTSPTLVRTRGSAMAWGDTLGGTYRIALGLIVLNESMAGVMTLTPISDPDADWYCYEWFISHPTTASTGTYWRQPIDCRSKRRLNEDEAIFFGVESDPADFNVLVGLSFLFKEA